MRKIDRELKKQCADCYFIWFCLRCGNNSMGRGFRFNCIRCGKQQPLYLAHLPSPWCKKDKFKSPLLDAAFREL